MNTVLSFLLLDQRLLGSFKRSLVWFELWAEQMRLASGCKQRVIAMFHFFYLISITNMKSSRIFASSRASYRNYLLLTLVLPLQWLVSLSFFTLNLLILFPRSKYSSLFWYMPLSFQHYAFLWLSFVLFADSWLLEEEVVLSLQDLYDLSSTSIR